MVKSRIQGAEKIPGVKPKYNWTYPALVTIAREEGLAALYKGFVPKVLRLAPGGGVLLLVVDFTLGVFRNGKYLFFIYGLIDFADDHCRQHWDLHIYRMGCNYALEMRTVSSLLHLTWVLEAQGCDISCVSVYGDECIVGQ